MATNFDTVVDNLKQAFGINRKKIYVKMVVTKDNHSQIGQMERFIEELGGIPEQKIIAPTGFALPALASEKDKEEFFDEVVSDEIEEHLKFTYDRSKPGYATFAWVWSG